MHSGFRPGRGRGRYNVDIDASKPPPPKVRPEYRTIGEYVQYYTRNHGERSEPVKWLIRRALQYEDGMLTVIEQSTPGQLHALLQDLLLQRRRP